MTFVSLSIFAQNKQSKPSYIQGTPKLIILDKSDNYPKSQSVALLKAKRQVSNDINFTFIKDESDLIGFEHTKYQETYKGLEVIFGHQYIHSKNGTIKSLNGDFFKVGNLNITPALSSEAALQFAISSVGAREYMWNNPSAELFNYSRPIGNLVILPDLLHKDSKQQAQPKLAYRFDIYASDPVSRAYVYVDANTGEILYTDRIIHHAVATSSADTRYSGTKSLKTDSYNGSYRLRDYSRGNGIETYDMNTGTNYNNAVDFTDNDNNWSAAEYNNNAKDNAALDAHYGAQMTYDYWSIKHGRNSFDNNGSAIKSYVHYDVAYDNAYWNGSVMTYGDGSDTYFDALTSLDVAAHEIGHAVMSYTADLTYSYESGAMNEAFSDIWGASVEYFAEPTKQTWLIGEDIERRSGHLALRSMSDPKSEGQPDTYQGTNWATGSSDNGGVHTNSGVLNYWYYLVSMGGSGTNDNGDSYSVSGIGIDKASNVAYRMESVYLTSSSQYADARTYAIQSAVDLYGSGSNEEIAVTNAFYAVGIGAAYGNTSYCASKGNNVNDEYIQRVQINSIDNSSGNGNGYSDFTSISTDLSINTSYTVTITPKWTGTVYNEGYAVWIDYNNDGDFDDSGELVWSKAASKNTPNTGTFTIPSSATQTVTRMRVSMKYNGIPTPCETFSYGEVEDYSVNIGGSITDTTPPVITLIGSSTINLNVGDTYTEQGASATDNVDGDISANIVIGGDTVNTNVAGTYVVTYNVSDAAGNAASEVSRTVYVTQPPTGGCTNGITSYPYNQSFENTFGNWTQYSGDDFDWSLRSGSTPSSNTGPSSASAGTYYIYMESSSPNYSNKRAILESPCFDLSNESQATMTFKYHMYGASNMGSLALEVSSDNGASWSSIWNKSGNQGNSWLTANIDLANFIGGTVQFRFNGITGTTWQGDMAVDAFTINGGTSGGSCEATTLSFTFDNYPEETSWDIKDANGTIVFSGGTYGSQADGSTLNIPLCVDSGCYTFTVYDAYGDGMCCSYGNGSYTYTQDSNGNVLASGGSFTSSDATNFCINTAAAYSIYNEPTGTSIADIVLYPSPVKDILNIELKDKKMKSYIITNLMGQRVDFNQLRNNSIDVSGLQSGVYIIEFRSDKKSLNRKFIKQ